MKSKSTYFLARIIDFLPIFGPLLMLTGYLSGRDLITKVTIERLTFRGYCFLLSALFTIATHFLLYYEIFFFFGKGKSTFAMGEKKLLLLLLVIASYVTYSLFLGVDIVGLVKKK